MAESDLRVALRFPTSQALRLRSICDQLATEGRHSDLSLFEPAAQSAERDEPLILIGADKQEAERIAHGFTRWGIDRPAIDELNG